MNFLHRFLSPNFLASTLGALLCLVASGAASGVANPQASAARPAAPGEAQSPRKGEPYVLDFDPVTGKSLGPLAGQVVRLHEGRELRFGSAETANLFAALPDKYLPAVDTKLIERQSPLYPLTTCLVSGDELGGEMGEPVDRIVGNRLVRFCCAGCLPKFQKKPDEYLAKLNAAAIEQQRAKYPLATCVVSGEKLGGEMGEPVEQVVAGRLLRFCCKPCIAKFEKDPVKFLALLEGGSPAKADAGATDSAVSYVCPMHADVVRPQPGRCPKCGMDLVKKK